jgi:rod shape-determining protein MreD
MTRVALVAVAVAAALMLQTVVGYQLFGRVIAMDLVLVVVVGTGIFFGPTAGLVTGSIAGLCQDAVSGGVLGVAGLAKTLAGFVAGVVATQFIVSGIIPRGVVFFALTWLHGVCFLGLYAMIGGHGLGRPWRHLLVQGLFNAVLGVFATQVIERGPEWWRRRQYTRRSEGRRRFAR